MTISRCCQPLSHLVSCGNDSNNTGTPGTRVETVLKKFSHACACHHPLAAATIQVWHLFCSELPIVRLLFEGGDYLMVVSV